MTGYSNELIRELGQITTRNAAGQHFTTWTKHWEEMEAGELISIHRPVHETGIPYDQQYWSLEVTQEGHELVDWAVDNGIIPVLGDFSLNFIDEQ